jgi:hypothetical protein
MDEQPIEELRKALMMRDAGYDVTNVEFFWNNLSYVLKECDRLRAELVAERAEIAKLERWHLEIQHQRDALWKALEETDSMLEVVTRQLESWGHRAVVNVQGCHNRNHAALLGEKL